jgi:hypothetical protein
VRRVRSSDQSSPTYPTTPVLIRSDAAVPKSRRWRTSLASIFLFLWARQKKEALSRTLLFQFA